MLVGFSIRGTGTSLDRENSGLVADGAARLVVRNCDFEDVLLQGLAADGGLYVPERWPTLDPDIDSDDGYAAVAAAIRFAEAMRARARKSFL